MNPVTVCPPDQLFIELRDAVRGRITVGCVDGEWHVLPARLPTAHTTITARQAVGVPVLVGGAVFGPGGRYARQFRADAWAPDARAAADEPAGRPLLRPQPDHRPIDDLRQPTDQEYTLAARGLKNSPRATGTLLAGATCLTSTPLTVSGIAE